MYIRLVLMVALIMEIIVFTPAIAQEYKDAPSLAGVTTWLRGEPITEFKKGQIYVVEFGWVDCPPCRAAIPHLTELSKQYDGEIPIISIYLESDSKTETPTEKDVQKVKSLMEALGGKHDHFTVGVSTSNSELKKAWGVNSGPTVFLMDENGKVAWKGHPQYLSPILESISKGQDLKSVVKNYKPDKLEVPDRIRKIYEVKDNGEVKKAWEMMDDLMAENPHLEKSLIGHKYKLLARTDVEKAYAYLDWMIGQELDGFDWGHLVNELETADGYTTIPRAQHNLHMDLKVYERIEKQQILEGQSPYVAVLKQAEVYAKLGDYNKAILLDSLAKGQNGYIYKYLKRAQQRSLTEVDAWIQQETDNFSWPLLSYYGAYLPNDNHALGLVKHVLLKARREGFDQNRLLRILNDQAFVYYRRGQYRKAVEVQKQVIAMQTEQVRLRLERYPELERSGNYRDPKLNEYQEILTYYEKLIIEESQADYDWGNLMEFGTEASNEELRAALKEGGYTEYLLCQHKYRRKALDLAAAFWDKYPLDERRKIKVFDLYLYPHVGLVAPWADTLISVETAEIINRKANQLDRQRIEAQAQGKKIITSSLLFRMIPRDLNGEAEWRKKRNEMALFAIQSTSSKVEQEEIEWKVFTSDWGQVATMWTEVPNKNEHLDDQTEQLEKDYWSLTAIKYWEGMYLRFDEHAMKYADLPVIADRALDFLGATAQGGGASKAAAETYWKRIIEDYGNPQYEDLRYSLTDKAGVQALLKQADVQVNADRVAAQEIPLELEFKALDGRQIDLDNLRGKVVLIDFWATWCQPCIKELPKLKQVYDQYKDKGFEIIGICLDDESRREMAQNILSEHGASWPQRFDGKSYLSDPFAKLYAIRALPTVWLLDRDGKIISRNARGKVLEEMLEKLFAE